MGSIRTALRKQFKVPTQNDVISETLMKRAKASGGLPPATGRELLELFLTNGVQHPGEAVIAQGYIGRGAGLSLTLDWGALVCPGFVEGTVSAGAGRSAGRNMAIGLFRQPGLTHTPDKPVCFIVGDGSFVQWSAKVGGTVGVKAEASLNAATGGSTMMTSDDDQKAAEDRAKKDHGDVGGPALGLIGLKASASAIAEAGLSYDAEWVFVRDASPRWYDSARNTHLQEDLAGWIGTRGTRAGVKERINQFFETNKSTIGVLAPRLTNLQALQRLITGGRVPMSMYDAALKDLASFLTWLQHALGTDLTKFKRELQALTSQIQKQQESNWMARRFNKSEKRAVKDKAAAFLSKLGNGSFDAKKGQSGYASLSALNTRLSALADALELSTDKVAYLQELSARLAAQVTAHQRQDVPAEHGSETEETTPEPPSAVPNNLTFISLMGTKKGASAGVKVEAIAAVEIPAIGSQLGGSAGVGAEHERKFTDYRLQHYASRKQGGHNVITVFTQDTHVAMIQTKLKANAQATAVVFGKDMLAKQDSEDRHAEAKASSTVNTMTYRSAHLTWSPPSPTSNTTPSLPGTGYSLGTSLAIQNFAALARGNQDVTTLALLSKTLNVRAENLWDVFKQLDYLADLGDERNGGPSAMLIETTFKTPQVDIPINWVDGEPQVGADGIAAVIGAHNPVLQAIRIRYRAVDLYNDSETGSFKLGIPSTKMALTFDLKSIREASHTGIIEYGTFWVGNWDRHNADASVPEDLVVPPVLIHQ